MLLCSLVLELYLPSCNSLKEKRSKIMSLKTLLKNKFNISIIEINNHKVELWQRSELGIAFVCNTRNEIENLVNSITQYVDSRRDIQLISKDVQIY